MTTTEAPCDVLRVRRDIAIRASDDPGDGRIATVYGHAARFEEWTEIDNWLEGHFMERIAAGAFKKTAREARGSVRFLFRHGLDPQIGDKVLGTFDELREDGEGLYYEAALFDTSYGRDLLPGLQAEPPQYGASFRARVVKEEWSQEPKRSGHNPDGLPERTIRELSLAGRDIGPCTFGAYPGATAAARSFDGIDPELLVQLAHDLRTRRGTAAAPEGTADPERAAATQDTEPADGHSGLHVPAVRMALLRHTRAPS